MIATLSESSQRIVLAQAVIDHMARYRQRSWYSSEAGGQLFGTIHEAEVLVSVATGPYRGDQRSRASYQSNPKAAQRAIDLHAESGNLYLGEWHTHPEDYPGVSSADRDAIARLRAASDTTSSALMMVIQGRVDGADGLAIYTLTDSGLLRWEFAGWQ